MINNEIICIPCLRLETLKSIGGGEGGGGILAYKRLMGMFRWMGSHFHDWIDYNGVVFSIELLESGLLIFRAVTDLRNSGISAKFPKKHEIPRNPPEIFPNTCRQNIFNTYLGY